jgi:pyruvate ferredoxin oxidoreductase delta subunit
MRSDVNKLGVDCKWDELTLGMQIYGPATATHFNTGEWATVKPVVDENKCIHCLMCVPVCPDSCISVSNGKRSPIDYDHCKGCGICVKSCPKKAISMEGVK